MIGRSPPGPPLRAVRSRLQLGGCGGSSNPLRLLLAGTVLAVALVGLGGRVGAVSAALGAARHSKREAASSPAVTLSGRFFPGPSPVGVARLPQVGPLTLDTITEASTVLCMRHACCMPVRGCHAALPGHRHLPSPCRPAQHS